MYAGEVNTSGNMRGKAAWNPMRRWENNIKMDIREIEWEGADWINLAQDRHKWRAVVNMVMNLRVSQRGKGTAWNPMRRWENNIKMDLQEIEWEDADCINFGAG
jgi:hypothetical protein